MTKILLTAAAYVTVVFPLAAGWHLGFKERYEAFGYFEGEPNILMGLVTIIIQGVVLALIYPLFHPGSTGFLRAFQFAGLMGLFFWTSHVLSFIARNTTSSLSGFFVMETGYLVVQFVLFGLVLGLIYRGVKQAVK